MSKYDQGGGCPCGLYKECRCEREPLSPVWVHRKTGGLYIILHTGMIESTKESVIVYKALVDGTIWIRPFNEFYDGRFRPVRRDELAWEESDG